MTGGADVTFTEEQRQGVRDKLEHFNKEVHERVLEGKATRHDESKHASGKSATGKKIPPNGLGNNI